MQFLILPREMLKEIYTNVFTKKFTLVGSVYSNAFIETVKEEYPSMLF